MVVLVVVVLAEHHGHLLCIVQAFWLLHVGHALFELLHRLVDLPVVEVVLDRAQHVCHAVEFADDQIDLLLARTHHELYRSILSRALLLLEPLLRLPHDVALLEHAVGHLNHLRLHLEPLTLQLLA